MRNLVIGDIHFGIKTNNTAWMESQLKLIEKQVIKEAIDNDVDNVIFLGDLFDIRYAINQVIGINVQRLVRKMSVALYNKGIVFIAGNHDYYSPIESLSEYNAYDLVFPPEFLDAYSNITIVNKDPYYIEDELFVPWYLTEDKDKLASYINNSGIKFNTIYCHDDLLEWTDEFLSKIGNPTVYAGHIHYLQIDEKRKLYNLGSALPLTFADSNSDRYLYIIEDGEIKKQIPNITTPKFKRFYNEDIFTISEIDLDNAFVQLCISDTNINKAQYIEQVKYLKNTYTDANLKINIITNVDTLTNVNNTTISTNIDDYISDNIPTHLRQKYDLVKEKIINKDK